MPAAPAAVPTGLSGDPAEVDVLFERPSLLPLNI